MDFEELLSQVSTAEFEGCTEVVDNIRKLYTNATEGANATIEKTQKDLDDAKKQITELQAQNYQLLMAATNKVDNSEPDKQEPTEDEKNITRLIDFGK